MPASAAKKTHDTPKKEAQQGGKGSPHAKREHVTLSQHAYRIHQVHIPITVSLEDALRPSYWTHVATGMRKFDEIRLVAEDGSWIAVALVTNQHPHFLTLKVLTEIDLEGEEIKELPETRLGFTVQHMGTRKYVVLRDVDGMIMAESIESKAAALKQRDEFIRNLVRE